MVLNAIHMQGGTHSVPGGLLEPSDAGHAGIHSGDDGADEAVTGRLMPSEQDEQQQVEVEEPPLVPLEPVVILHQPELLPEPTATSACESLGGRRISVGGDAAAAVAAAAAAGDLQAVPASARCACMACAPPEQSAGWFSAPLH
jgi:hypothetical protein